MWVSGRSHHYPDRYEGVGETGMDSVYRVLSKVVMAAKMSERLGQRGG